MRLLVASCSPLGCRCSLIGVPFHAGDIPSSSAVRPCYDVGMLLWLLPWVLPAGADWIAWTEQEQHGSADAQGWQMIPRADQFHTLEWEVEGEANGYRYFYPGAQAYVHAQQNLFLLKGMRKI